jgi:hypothetical protein
MPSESTQFKPGNKANPSGRPKGAKSKVRFDVAQTLKDLKYCPFTHLYQMATDETWSKRERTQAACELASYVAPKLKAVEISSDSAKEGFQMILNVGAQKQTDGDASLQRDENSESVPS